MKLPDKECIVFFYNNYQEYTTYPSTNTKTTTTTTNSIEYWYKLQLQDKILSVLFYKLNIILTK